MQDHYNLLRTIFEIVKDDPQPENYACRPRELILRRFQDWTVIYQELRILENEGLVTTEQQDTLIIRITAAGFEKMKEPGSLVNESGDIN
ncbi:MAG TPA: hypothetical protein VFS36_03300 [Chitinophagaceae bacterium]|jgi:hypothetical protein|nr:hypothetical protein [Chitinophagaceae bacterium]